MWASEENEENRNDEDINPSDWDEEEDVDQWKNKAQQDMDREADREAEKAIEAADGDTANATETTGGNLSTADGGTKRRQSRPRAVSKHYNLLSTEPLTEPESTWIFAKSIMLWVYLVVISTGFLNYKSHSPQTIWMFAYFILFIVWCLFFRITASASRGGWYPLIGDWKEQTYHTVLFLFGLAGIDMYYLERKKVIMRECIMQYKVVEFSILWFAYFMSLSWQQYPWSEPIGERYEDWSTHFDSSRWFELVNTIPILLLLMDSVLHYSKVYHSQFWDHLTDNCVLSKLYYIAVLFILWIDTLIRGLLLILFVRVSVGTIWIAVAYYGVYLVSIWMTALGKSMDAPGKQFRLMMKKTGGKLFPAWLISFWSVCGLFQILPTIKLASSDIQLQQRMQQKWGKNVIRLDCFLRLLGSVVLFIKFWVMRNWKFEFEQKFIVYIVLIAFALYPYAMELLFQTPLSLLCRGSFFLVHHVDTLTSLSNIYRFNKDFASKFKWKMGLVVTNIRKFSDLNEKFGRKCADSTLIRFMQRIVFEIEDQSGTKMRLYRGKDDRFLIVTGFPTDDEFKEFVMALSRISINVQRPSDFDENDKRNQSDAHKKDDDGKTDEENQNDAQDDDFINPNANSGYGGGGNWFDDDEEEEEDGKKDADKATSGSALRAGLKRRNSKKSTYNKRTANETIEMTLRVAGSFGAFCSLEHVMSIDEE
eukprot:CAMPEP_0197021242 /NCGR_PEP_ID=MMETSP1384-20130603/2142_1 /TAXON_ID=29189 /ORGANISM="Ammonia sp." /LENGTH=704 /DNA_ID=CAMNT_0042449023 /DNA_START=47 /DNA_END=2158 /DNA_ORIENTATION=-